jgi:hypothetical protein
MTAAYLLASDSSLLFDPYNWTQATPELARVCCLYKYSVSVTFLYIHIPHHSPVLTTHPRAVRSSNT